MTTAAAAAVAAAAAAVAVAAAAAEVLRLGGCGKTFLAFFDVLRRFGAFGAF